MSFVPDILNDSPLLQGLNPPQREAVEYRGELQHAVVYDPLRQEIFSATRGEGAQLDGRRIPVQLQHGQPVVLAFRHVRRRFIAESARDLGHRVAVTHDQHDGVVRQGAHALGHRRDMGRTPAFEADRLGPCRMGLRRRSGGQPGAL